MAGSCWLLGNNATRNTNRQGSFYMTTCKLYASRMNS